MITLDSVNFRQLLVGPLEICCKNNEILFIYLFTLKGTKNRTLRNLCVILLHFYCINMLASVCDITPAKSAPRPALILLLLLGGKEELAHLSPLPFTMWSMMMKAVSQLSKYRHVQRACSLYKNVSDSGLHFNSDLYFVTFQVDTSWLISFPHFFLTYNPQPQLVRTCL